MHVLIFLVLDLISISSPERFLPLIFEWQRSHAPPHSDVGFAARYGHGAAPFLLLGAEA
jgi:hypothetical protein